MSLLALQRNGETSNPSLDDNLVLDEFEIPFGEWMDQAIDWVDVNLEWLLKIIKWPFDTLIRYLVEDILEPVSWVWVVLAFFILGTLVRNVKVGAFAAVGLSVCGLLGNNYWYETVRTIGFIAVAVILCVAVGIPLGIACGRVDRVWQIVRPILDAMQVVHSFVYMLPFIYFFGLGEVSATMVTMVFALPPLVRLTNLGIRQVPADVVEASRAYGAPEWRVLADVQIPLARPAIMTGINQTLLLSISMLGIAAIMGAGGLGSLLLNAINRQSVPDGTASGLSFFLVAVVLDRIAQSQDVGSASLLRRIRLAWSHRVDPEALLPNEELPDTNDIPEQDLAEGRFAEVSSAERKKMLVAAFGGAIAIVSVFLTWSNDAGLMSAYGRRVDEQLPGESFNGLAASGGSWYGYLALVLGLFVMAAALKPLVAPGRGPRWWSADGAVIASLALVVMMAVYLLVAPSVLTVGQSTGIGAYVALLGGLVAALGSLLWIRLAPHSPAHPLSSNIGWGRVVGSAVATVIIGIGAVSGWSFDKRGDVVITPELQAQIDELVGQEAADSSHAGVRAMEIQTLMATASIQELIVIDGVSSEGTGLGLWSLLASVAGLAASLPAAGVFGRDEHRQWRWSAITSGVGAGIACVGFGWIFTQVRSADDNYVSGVGSFLAMLGGCILIVTAVTVLKEFRRSKVYTDTEPTLEPILTSTDEELAPEGRPVA